MMQSKEALKIDRQWFYIRDLFFGWNWLSKDPFYAISLAKTCPHVDAQWLYNSFHSCKTHEDIVQVFKGKPLTCSRGLIFFACFLDQTLMHSHTIELAAEQNNALALAFMASDAFGSLQKKLYAEASAAQGEREGYYQLYCYFSYYTSTVEEKANASVYLEKCALLNRISAMTRMVAKPDVPDVKKWKFALKCLRYGRKMNLNSAPRKAEFYIGFKAKKYVRFFLSSPNIPLTNDQLEILEQVEHFKNFHTHICKQIKATIDMFSLCARRLGMVKDMRIYIGKMIWNTRWEADT
ncbi:MAG: hypothetical protein K2Q45_00355 [Nitrosomonas sp.]|nr:hypothetical protein [Nitrosomonas sp.]